MPGRFLRPLLLLLGLVALWGPLPETHSDDGDPVGIARRYLQESWNHYGLGPELTDLQVVLVQESLGAQHVRFQQTVDGIPVFGAYITVNINKTQREVNQVFSRYRRGLPRHGNREAIGEGQAVDLARQAVGVQGDPRGPVSAQRVFYPLGKEYVLAWQVLYPAAEPLGDWLVVVGADDSQVLLQHNLLDFDSGRVFDPNPPVSSGGTIPPPSDCDSAANEALLSSQYFDRTLLGIAGIPGVQNQLKGDYVDLTAPGILGGYKAAGQANEPTRTYNYPCNDDKFEEVMVYYWVDTTQRKIQSLGFTGTSGIVDRAIPAHAHWGTGSNAFYSAVDRGLHFLDGSVAFPTDAAEDADVIIHEYGHAIQDDQVPGWGFAPSAFQTRAMGEGFGDFLAGAITGNPCFAEWWDGTLACGGPGLRDLQNSATWTGTTATNLPSWCSDPNSIYCVGLIWGGALWDLVEALGNDQAARDLVLRLVLDSHFYLDPEASFAEAAAALRQADIDLNGGANLSTIDGVLAARGLTAGTVADFPYFYLRIRHTWRGDLDVQLKVGNVASPDCTINIKDQNGADGADDVILYGNLSGTSCEPFLPPSSSRPWWLEVRDVFAGDIGTIEGFEVALSGTQRCIASDVPVAIPDNNGFVYSRVDCSNLSEALPTATPTSTPTPRCIGNIRGGVYDDQDRGLQGITVVLERGGSQLASTLTGRGAGAPGAYDFLGLDRTVSPYRVRVVIPAGYQALGTTSHDVVLTFCGQNLTDMNFVLASLLGGAPPPTSTTVATGRPASPTATPTETSTPTFTATSTPTPTSEVASPTPTPSPSPSATPTPSLPGGPGPLCGPALLLVLIPLGGAFLLLWLGARRRQPKPSPPIESIEAPPEEVVPKVPGWVIAEEPAEQAPLKVVPEVPTRRPRLRAMAPLRRRLARPAKPVKKLAGKPSRKRPAKPPKRPAKVLAKARRSRG